MKRVVIILTVCLLVFSAYAQEEDFVFDDQGRRDPFWRLVTPSGVIVNYDADLLVSDLTLEGIIFEPGGKGLAIINGKIVKKNDKVGHFRVFEIGENQVVLIKGQEKFILQLKKEE